MVVYVVFVPLVRCILCNYKSTIANELFNVVDKLADVFS